MQIHDTTHVAELAKQVAELCGLLRKQRKRAARAEQSLSVARQSCRALVGRLNLAITERDEARRACVKLAMAMTRTT